MSKSKFDKICKVCNDKYLYCSGCQDYAKLPRWMESFCSDNCRKIAKAEMEFRAGVKTIDQAKAELEKCDLSKKDQFVDWIKESIDKIFGGSKKVETPVEEPAIVEEAVPAEEPKTEEPEAAAVEEPKVEEPAVEEKKEEHKSENNGHYKYNKFNNYKKNNFKK